MNEGSPVGAHVIKMMGYIKTLEKLGFPLKNELTTDVILQSLPNSFKPFVLNFNVNEINKTLPQLFGMLRIAEGNMKKNSSKSILMVREANKKKKAKSKGSKPKEKDALKPEKGISKDRKCFYCEKFGHSKRNCPLYLEEVKKAKANGASSSGINSKIISFEKTIVEEALLQLPDNKDIESMGIANSGCSFGPNTLLIMSEIIGVVQETCGHLGRPVPEFRLFLNDLYNNDFNYLFMSLPTFIKRLKEDSGIGEASQCFIAGVPGSFYGRLILTNTLHYVYSFSNLNWLSQSQRFILAKYC
ncbi:hypothetical protein GQ457_03G012930 [Hibiscus cannabinus]